MGSYHLFTKHYQLSLHDTEQGLLMLHYIGPRLHNPQDALAVSTAEWPLLSTEIDELTPFGNFSGESALSIRTAHGTNNLQLRYAHHHHEQLPGGCALLFTLADPNNPSITATVRLETRDNEDVFSIRTTLHNIGNTPISILRAYSAALRLQAPQYHLTAFRGAWSGENGMQEQPIARGLCVSAGSTSGIQNAQAGTPGFILSLGSPATEQQGHCLLGALCWSGNYTLQFKHNSYGHLFTGMGHDFAHSPYRLEAGQSLHLPEALLVYSRNGKGEASRSIHHYLRHHILPHGTSLRRSLLNSWEGVHFDVTQSTVCDLIRATAPLGAELFVLDDGWFGRRDDDTSSLGDWEADPRKLPLGLAPLADQAADLGLGFGIWVEPEMISPHSNLFRSHPDWVLHLPDRDPKQERHQLVLDLCNPQVQDFILTTVSHILTSTPGISYVKWDCNRKISDAAAPSLPAALQGNLHYDYITAYYTIMRKLRERFPDVTFQCCSAGGGRLDCGAAAYHEEFWLSDNTDAYERLRMQWSASHFFPANAIGCHVTASPNIYTGRETSLKFRFDVALSGRIGLELDPRTLTPQQQEEFRHRLLLASRLRPIVQLGELYRLVSPYESEDCALLYRCGKQALLLAYTTQRHFTNQHTRIPVHGLTPLARYHISEIGIDRDLGSRSPINGSTLGGDAIMQNGIPIHWNRPLQSCTLLLEEVSDG